MALQPKSQVGARSSCSYLFLKIIYNEGSFLQSLFRNTVLIQTKKKHDKPYTTITDLLSDKKQSTVSFVLLL